MNKKYIDKLIPKAVKELNTLVKKGKIDKVYQGYLASFGATVIQSGLLQTVLFYSAKEDKNKVIKIMYKLIKEDLKATQPTMEEFLLTDNNHKNYTVKNKILEANIACKLSIRTFELEE